MESIHSEKNKPRTISTSSNTSVTEYVNELYENSDAVLDKLNVSVYSVNNSQKIFTLQQNEEIKEAKVLQNFSEIQVDDEEPDKFIPVGFRKMYLAALVVLQFAVCMGIAATYSATATTDMQKAHSSIHPNEDEVSWIGSLLAIGALMGGTAGGYFSNSLGRKGALVFNTVPFVAGWLLIAYANNAGLIFTGRILTGFSCGIVSVTTPMYLVEISTPEIRGLLGASFQLFVVIGVLVVSILGSTLTWRWLAISGATTSLLAAFLMILMPESPRWLMSQNRREEAKLAIIFLQGHLYDAESECRALEEEIQKQPAGGFQIKEFLVPTFYKPFVLSILLMFFQQFSGINAVLFYTVDIFKNSHVPLNPVTATIIVSFVQVLATLLSSLLMDKAGRKPLLYISGLCMALSLYIFGGYAFSISKNKALAEHYGWLPVICLTAYTAAFAMGFGPTPWLMVAEMTPARSRSIVSGVSTALNWTFAFVITKSFSSLQSIVHDYGAYVLYGSLCATSLVLTKFFLPETKGMTMNEIEDFFKKQ